MPPGSGRAARGRDGGAEESSGAPSSWGSAGDESSLSSDGGWSEGGDGSRPGSREGYDVDRGSSLRDHRPEETAAGRSTAGGRRERGRCGGESDEGSGKGSLDGVSEPEGGDALAEGAAEEHGLLSRLRSVAQEARLEVMDSRLQELHVS